ncbi:MAG TPA: arginine deiminase family protein [Pyrinomonadaceae bacterium]
MLIGFTHIVSPNIANCELTYLERAPVNYERAVRQHKEYCGFLNYHGVKALTLDGSAAHPDSCFVEDTAIVVDEVAIIASMGAAARRQETAAMQKALAPYRPLEFMRLPATIDGGDVVKLGRTILVGLSSRTNALAAQELRRILEPLGYRIITVAVRGSLHLTTACSALDKETLLVNPRWIDLEPLAGFRLLFVPEDEPWAANTLRIADTICLEAGAPKTAEIVRRHHDRIELLDISEFRKAEGSLTCLSIIFEDKIG